MFLPCGFFFLSFPRLISAVADWMSATLPHMVWPYCTFKMQVWNVRHAAHWKYRTQKVAKRSPSGHHRTTLSGYIFATKAHIDNQKKNLLSGNISSTCPDSMVNFGSLAAEIGLVVWGTPANFNRFCFLATLLHGISVLGISQTLWHWRGRHLYLAGRPSHWALAHILVFLLYIRHAFEW